MKQKNEFIYFAFRSPAFVVSFSIILILSLIGIFGPFLLKYKPLDYVGPQMAEPNNEFWWGTTIFGQDVFTQSIHGIRETLIVGLFGGIFGTFIGLLIGFFAGYKGGIIDEILMMITNILMVIPTLALLIIIASLIQGRSVLMQGIIIGFTSWPWMARTVRAQTFSLKQRGFVDLSRVTCRSSLSIIIEDIAPNMLSFVFMAFILQFGGSILAATGLDFIGLGPTNGITLGLMMQFATMNNSIQLGIWWWAIPPGLIITLLVASLYMMNTGLDEVFNPKLRKT